ncbi:MAG: hypothetical protein ACE5JA_02650 [bacterium]
MIVCAVWKSKGGGGCSPVRKISGIWQSECHTLVPGTGHKGSRRRFALYEPVLNPTAGSTRLSYRLDTLGPGSVRAYD